MGHLAGVGELATICDQKHCENIEKEKIKKNTK